MNSGGFALSVDQVTQIADFEALHVGYQVNIEPLYRAVKLVTTWTCACNNGEQITCAQLFVLGLPERDLYLHLEIALGLLQVEALVHTTARELNIAEEAARELVTRGEQWTTTT